MDYERTGRKLGTGLKVLGRMAKQRMDPAESAPAAGAKPAPVAAPVSVPIPVVQSTARKVSAVREGGRSFGKAVWGPFSRAGHVLWLEITGVFFALFAVYFATEAWKLRVSVGVERRHFWAFAIFALLFGYFCVSSFVRARRREKR